MLWPTGWWPWVQHIRFFDPKYLGCLAVGQLEKPVVGLVSTSRIKCFVMSESTWICGWWARLSHVSLFNSLAPGHSQLSTRLAMAHGPLFSATKSEVAARNLQNPLFQWQQLCPLTAKEEGASFALGGHKMSVIIQMGGSPVVVCLVSWGQCSFATRHDKLTSVPCATAASLAQRHQKRKKGGKPCMKKRHKTAMWATWWFWSGQQGRKGSNGFSRELFLIRVTNGT